MCVYESCFCVSCHSWSQTGIMITIQRSLQLITMMLVTHKQCSRLHLCKSISEKSFMKHFICKHSDIPVLVRHTLPSFMRLVKPNWSPWLLRCSPEHRAYTVQLFVLEHCSSSYEACRLLSSRRLCLLRF